MKRLLQVFKPPQGTHRRTSGWVNWLVGDDGPDQVDALTLDLLLGRDSMERFL